MVRRRHAASDFLQRLSFRLDPNEPQRNRGDQESQREGVQHVGAGSVLQHEADHGGRQERADPADAEAPAQDVEPVEEKTTPPQKQADNSPAVSIQVVGDQIPRVLPDDCHSAGLVCRDLKELPWGLAVFFGIMLLGWGIRHWLNSYKPLIIPHFFGSAYLIFLLRQFYRGLPKDYEEAALILAEIDGVVAAEEQIYLSARCAGLASPAGRSLSGTFVRPDVTIRATGGRRRR
jgi:hypothetical protein